MTDFLLSLGKANLAMCAAILAVYLLRRPVRAAFHARIAYGLWLLVPVAALACLLPPRMATQGTLAPVKLFIGGGMAMPTLPAPQDVPQGWSWLVFGAWMLGAAMMVFYLLRLQRGFNCAERAGMAGPAVVGFVKPRIVVPADFQLRFNAGEQAAILAHEQAHLARQDTRVNAVVALLRCLCWFNPLVHMASTWMRRDQELACDAVALRSVPRLDYANTLLKAQMPVVATALGCTWPGSEHPLTERIALLNHKQPASARRFAGIALLIFIAGVGGLIVWVAQPNAPQPGPMAGNTTDPETTEWVGKTLTSSQDDWMGIRIRADVEPEIPAYPRDPKKQGLPIVFEGNAQAELRSGAAGYPLHITTVWADTLRIETTSGYLGEQTTRLIADGNVVLTQDRKTVRGRHLEANVVYGPGPGALPGVSLVPGEVSLSP